MERADAGPELGPGSLRGGLRDATAAANLPQRGAWARARRALGCVTRYLCAISAVSPTAPCGPRAPFAEDSCVPRRGRSSARRMTQRPPSRSQKCTRPVMRSIFASRVPRADLRFRRKFTPLATLIGASRKRRACRNGDTRQRRGRFSVAISAWLSARARGRYDAQNPRASSFVHERPTAQRASARSRSMTRA